MDRQDIIKQAIERAMARIGSPGDNADADLYRELQGALSAIQQGQAIKDKGEPVAWMNADFNTILHSSMEQWRLEAVSSPPDRYCHYVISHYTIPLYTHPAKVEQGRVMTDEVREEIVRKLYPMAEHLRGEDYSYQLRRRQACEETINHLRDNGYLAHPPEEAGVWIPGTCKFCLNNEDDCECNEHGN